MPAQPIYRPQLVTAGVALAGASMLAVSPVSAPALPDTPLMPDIQLTAIDFDPLGSLAGIFDTTSTNATAVAETFFEAPGAVLQQSLVNQFGFVGDLVSNPANIGDVLQGVGGNIKEAFQAATFLGLDLNINSSITELAPILAANDGMHTLFAVLAPTLLGESIDNDALTQVLTQAINFAASPASGVLMGLAGPFASPAVPFINPFMELASGGDPATALGGLLNAPLDAINGFFNGSALNLDPLLPIIAQTGILPEELQIGSLSLAFGGLFSPGGTALAPGIIPDDYTIFDPNMGIGGSMLNSLGLNIPALGPLGDIPGEGIGPLGALTNLSQMIAAAIGWDGTGNPLTGLEFPTLPTELFNSFSVGDFDLGNLLPGEMFGNIGGIGDALGDAFNWMASIPQILLNMLTSAF